MPTSKLLPFQRARRPAQIAKSAWPSRTSTATSRAANIFPLSCCNDWPPSSSSGSICPSKSLRAEAAWPRSPESPCLFFSPPRLGVQQLRHEDILAGQPALGKTLLEVVAQESVERLAIGFDAIGHQSSPSNWRFSSMSGLSHGIMVSILLKVRPLL
jgi:hypothetical protein